MSSPAAPLRNRAPRIASAAVDRARLTVVPRARTRAARVPFVSLVTIVLVLGVVGLLLFNTGMQQASFAQSALEREATALAARQQTLQMELEDLRNPQRVASQAQEMGMVVPAAPTFMTVDGVIRGEQVPAVAEDRINLQPPPPVKPKVLDPAPTVIKVKADPATTGATRPKARAAKQGRSDRR